MIVESYIYISDAMARFHAAMYDSPDECLPPRLVCQKDGKTCYVKLGDPSSQYAVPVVRIRKGNAIYAILTKSNPFEGMALSGKWYGGGRVSMIRDTAIAATPALPANIAGDTYLRGRISTLRNVYIEGEK